jgi:hypothetical protein
MMPKIRFFALLVLLVLAREGPSAAQSPPASSSQPLNASISDYGTTFIFSPPANLSEMRGDRIRLPIGQ